MSTHYNNVAQAVSGTPGTGTITLGSAVTGAQSLGAATGSANATVDVFITDGNAWEVARNCTYTHSGTTLTRGTLEASSTGAVLSLTSAAVVRVAASADSGRRWDAAALEHVTGTDAATTMVVNTLYVVDLSGWSANRTYTLPTTAAVGDRIGIMVQTGSATRHVAITAASGDTLNGVAGGTEWTRMFNAGDTLILRCISANTAWIVEIWRPVNTVVLAQADGSTTQTGLVRNDVTKLTTVLATEVSNPSGEWNHTNKEFIPRRAGKYQIAICCQIVGIQSGSASQMLIYKNGSSILGGEFTPIGLTSSPVSIAQGTVDAAAGDVFDARVYYEDGTTNRNTTAVVSNNYFTAYRVGD